MLNLPGHTPGHHGLLVRLASGPVMLSGDTYHFAEQVAHRGVPPFNTNRADSLASMDRFDRLARNLHARVIIQHEPADVAKLAGLSGGGALKALLSTAPGGPETLKLTEVDDPVPGPGQLLVRVKACAINYPDVLIIEDKYQFKPDRPFAPGGEIAGIVEVAGDGVTGWSPGDRLIAMLGHGGLAEKVVVSAAAALPLPQGRGFEEGSALILTYATTIHALLDRGKLKEGETLLVLGAAGGVGLAAVELGKAFGARVVAAVSSEEKAEAAKGGRRGRRHRLSARPVRQGRREGAGAAIQGGGRPERRGPDLRSGRRRLYRGGAAGDRLGGAAARHRLSRRHPQAAAQPDPAEELRRARRLLGRLRRARSQGQCRPRPDPVPPLGGGKDRAEGQPDLAARPGRRGDRPHGRAPGGRQARGDDGREPRRAGRLAGARAAARPRRALAIAAAICSGPTAPIWRAGLRRQCDHRLATSACRCAGSRYTLAAPASGKNVAPPPPPISTETSKGPP